jgi:ketosteroid isomerase-like protein
MEVMSLTLESVMSRNTVEAVTRFAAALDDDDFTALAAVLADDCEYVTPKGTIRGRQQVIASYKAASVSAKSRIDKVRYESSVRSERAGRTIVTFIDHLEHGGASHTYSCEQAINLDAEVRVCRIVHQELPGEREALDLFLGTIKRNDKP